MDVGALNFRHFRAWMLGDCPLWVNMIKHLRRLEMIQAGLRKCTMWADSWEKDFSHEKLPKIVFF